MHGGLKATVADVARHLPHYRFALRTDVKDYYASLDHELLLERLAAAFCSNARHRTRGATAAAMCEPEGDRRRIRTAAHQCQRRVVGRPEEIGPFDADLGDAVIRRASLRWPCSSSSRRNRTPGRAGR